MIAFVWIIAAIGVAYAAKLSGRPPFVWFVFAVIASPLLGSAALYFANRSGWF